MINHAHIGINCPADLVELVARPRRHGDGSLWQGCSARAPVLGSPQISVR